MKSKPYTLCLIAVICISLFFTVGCEKEEIKDDEGTLSYGTLKDIDGNLYGTVKIGQQEWMAENLKVTRYNDGQVIPTGLSAIEWSAIREGTYAVYPHEKIDGIESDTETIEAYGLHYNWSAVESGKLCPAGWRVPRPGDWEELLWHLIDNYDHIDRDNVGAFLKSCRQVDSPLKGECNTSEHPRWNAEGVNWWFLDLEPIHPGLIELEEQGNLIWPPLAGTDEFGFSAYPAGTYSPTSESGRVHSWGLGYESNFWVDHIWTHEFPFPYPEGEIITTKTVGSINLNGGPGSYGGGGGKSGDNEFVSSSNGYSVRCVRVDSE
jgi:uncharacterized protein (TIGR02145 family)